MTLLLYSVSPSLYGLIRMLDICNKFAIYIFNSKKTICIKYGEDDRISEQVYIYIYNPISNVYKHTSSMDCTENGLYNLKQYDHYKIKNI